MNIYGYIYTYIHNVSSMKHVGLEEKIYWMNQASVVPASFTFLIISYSSGCFVSWCFLGTPSGFYLSHTVRFILSLTRAKNLNRHRCQKTAFQALDDHFLPFLKAWRHWFISKRIYLLRNCWFIRFSIQTSWWFMLGEKNSDIRSLLQCVIYAAIHHSEKNLMWNLPFHMWIKILNIKKKIVSHVNWTFS